MPSLPNPLIIFGETYSGLTIPVGEDVQIYQGGAAIAFEDQGTIEVYSGGTLEATAVDSGGVVTVEANGLFSDEGILSSGAYVVPAISAGGVVSGAGMMAGTFPDYGLISGLTLSNGLASVYAGGVAEGMTLIGGAGVVVMNGGRALGNILDGGYEVVSAGGYASGGLVLSTAIFVEGGGAAVGITVATNGSIYGGGMLVVSTGGTVSSSVISSGGGLLLEDNDQVAGVTVSSGGVLDLSFDIGAGIGSASFTVPASPITGAVTIDGVSVLAGGTIIYANATDDGMVDLPEGALASAVSVGPGYTLEGGGTIVGETAIFDGPDPNQIGGLISGVTIGAAFDPGAVTVSGTASDVGVRDGQLTMADGGVLSGAVVDANGLLVLSPGAVAQDVTLEHGGVVEFFNLSATSVQRVGSQLEVFSGGVVVDTVGLAGNLAALQLTSSVVDGVFGVYSTFITATQADVRADFEGGGVSDILIENTAGAVVVGQAGAGQQETYVQVAGLGPEWSILGAGDFLGGGLQDFLMESTNGALVAGAVAGGQTTYTQIGVLGAGVSVKEVLDNLGAGGQSGLVVEAADGALQLAAYIRGSLEFTSLGGLGPEWNFVGAGDFLGDGRSGYLIENSNGAVVVGEVSCVQGPNVAGPQDPAISFRTASVVYAQVAALGPEWSIVESGDFLGNGKTDFLMENTNGALVVGEVGAGGQAGYTAVGGLGPEWSFVGAGDYFGTGRDGFLIESTSGVVVEGTIAAGHVTYAQVGALGPEWKFHA